ncbi:hypothetical protein TNCV_2655511 [Trichonephila clavipes]|nr:hypothetical protein TNCV_2655511 [Trichonephila clavipes]
MHPRYSGRTDLDVFSSGNVNDHCYADDILDAYVCPYAGAIEADEPEICRGSEWWRGVEVKKVEGLLRCRTLLLITIESRDLSLFKRATSEKKRTAISCTLSTRSFRESPTTKRPTLGVTYRPDYLSIYEKRWRGVERNKRSKVEGECIMSFTDEATPFVLLSLGVRYGDEDNYRVVENCRRGYAILMNYNSAGSECVSTSATRGLLETDHAILNHGEVTRTTPELNNSAGREFL